MPKPQEPVKDDPSRDPGAPPQRLPKSPIEKDRDGAMASVEVITRLLEELPNRRTTLRAAKETFDPGGIRRAAADLEQSQMLLMLARDGVRRGLIHPSQDHAAFLDAEKQANDVLGTLAEEVARARTQADQLAATAGGTLSQLPRTAPSTSPEETRARAAQAAPLGLCDDKTMQSPESHACPLVTEQRDALRDLVTFRLAGMAQNWSDAAHEMHLKTSLEPLFKKSGLNPFLDLLVSVAMSWFTGQIGALAVGAVNAGRGVRATAAVHRSVDTVSLQPIPMPDLRAKAPDLPKPATALVSGLASKLTEHALNGGKAIDRASGQDAMFQGIMGAASAWGTTSKMEVRQLPDPVLVSLAEGLKEAPFSLEFFKSKIAALVANFKQIETIGVVKIGEAQPLMPVRVVTTSGQVRLALARAHTVLVDNPRAGYGAEPGNDQIERPTAKFVFEAWVDKSLASIALGMAPASAMLFEGDQRWATPPPSFAVDASVDVQMTAMQPSTGATP